MHPLPLPRRPDVVADRSRAESHAVRPATHVLVRDAEQSEVSDTARLHVRHLPLGLFPQLGRRFVARWHRAHVQSPHAVVLVAVTPGTDGGQRISGFLVGATDRQAFRDELLTRHRRSMLTCGAVALIGRPRVLLRFLRTRLRPYLSRLRPVRAPVSVPPGAVRLAPIADLTAIAVSPELRRTGTGSRLTDEFLRRCEHAGATKVELTTVADSEESIAFYTRTGWTALRSHTARDGRLVQRFAMWIDRTGED